MPKLYTSRPNRWEWLAIALIIALAALLRLGWPGNVEFLKDSIHLSSLSLDMAHGRSFPLLGIESSVGLPNPPMSVYIFALPYLFSDNPLFASGFVAVLNVIAVGMLYALARRYYGPQAALIAALLYAVSPRAVLYSRFIWQQNLLPVFVIGTVATALLGFLEGKRWAQLLHLPLLMISGQLHYAAIVLVPITLVLFGIGRRRVGRELYFGLAVALLFAVPFALGVANRAKSGGDSVSLNGTSNLLTNAAIFDTQLAISGKLERSLPQARPEDQLFSTLPLVEAIAALWLLFRLIRRRDNRSPIDLTLLLWLMTTSMVFSFTWTAVYLHYMITMLPGAFLIIGVAASDLWTAFSGKWLRLGVLAVGGIGLGVLVSVQAYLLIMLISVGNAPNVADSVGVPLGYYVMLRDNILSKLPAKVIINSDDQDNSFGYDRNAWAILLYNVPSVQDIAGGTDIYPAEKAVYVSHQCTNPAESFWLSNPVGCYSIGWRSAADFDLSAYTPANDAHLTFPTGASIIGYSWQPEKGCLSLAWKVNPPMLPDAPPGYVGPNYEFALQFYNADRTVILPVGGMGWQGDYLQIGDIAVKSFCLSSIPQQAIAGVRVRMYMTGGAQGYAAELFDAKSQSIGVKPINIPFGTDVAADETM